MSVDSPSTLQDGDDSRSTQQRGQGGSSVSKNHKRFRIGVRLSRGLGRLRATFANKAANVRSKIANSLASEKVDESSENSKRAPRRHSDMIFAHNNLASERIDPQKVMPRRHSEVLEHVLKTLEKEELMDSDSCSDTSSVLSDFVGGDPAGGGGGGSFRHSLSLRYADKSAARVNKGTNEA
eukprot:CAMPEP_0116843266 /NCGR_PEP_ID=MMETSP0418-20121206/11988_1 /TAXON_ID=1158023 /ORGANISM="Astrosyne radiata, Strain 13vi08-1A" /LENGTH=180 /DNA_ID=CAMNT_0004473991 /DNA_START=189 /DNA_END=731 /DNA_ORIENTATION=-